MKKVMGMIFLGIAWGCTVLVFVNLVGIAIKGEVFLQISAQEYMKQVICSIITGIGFTLPSLVYNNENVARGIQVVIHMGIGLTVYFLVSFYAGWIPVQYGISGIISTVVIALITSFAIWFCFYLYHKEEAKKINKKLNG